MYPPKYVDFSCNIPESAIQGGHHLDLYLDTTFPRPSHMSTATRFRIASCIDTRLHRSFPCFFDCVSVPVKLTLAPFRTSPSWRGSASPFLVLGGEPPAVQPLYDSDPTQDSDPYPGVLQPA